MQRQGWCPGLRHRVGWCCVRSPDPPGGKRRGGNAQGSPRGRGWRGRSGRGAFPGPGRTAVDRFSYLAKLLAVMAAKLSSPGQRKARARFPGMPVHPSRLHIVEKLARGERCVGKPAQLAGAERPTVSRHLTLLPRAGLVADQKRGAQVFDGPNPSRVVGPVPVSGAARAWPRSKGVFPWDMNG
ncbi:ArsR/SmtB family transcription factor [Limisphaera sp. VF-2]|uniref:ArsR/SmtB family transcription factor n=1 Tax=Limisphaera sp. VF-2 TaxID=3400418 RepID=UPI001766C30F